MNKVEKAALESAWLRFCRGAKLPRERQFQRYERRCFVGGWTAALRAAARHARTQNGKY